MGRKPYVLAAISLLVAVLAGGCDDPPPPGGDADADADVVRAELGDTLDDTTDRDGGETTPSDVADTADTAPPPDSNSSDGGDTSDATDTVDGGSAYELVHRPPECSVATQTCLLTVSTETQSGLKAQVIRATSGVQGETVVFSIESGSQLLSLGSTRTTTGPQGRAGIQIQTSSQTGMARVRAAIEGRNADPVFWDLTVE